MNFKTGYPILKISDISFSGKPTGFKDEKIILIDKDGNYTEYKNPNIAAKGANTFSSSIYNCLKGRSHMAAGYAVGLASDFIVEKDGCKKYDEDKIKLFAQNELSQVKPKREIGERRLVAYPRTLEPEPYTNISEAEKLLFADRQGITRCADREQYTCAERVFIWEDEILDEHGNVHYEKGKEIAKKQFNKMYNCKSKVVRRLDIAGKQLVSYSKTSKPVLHTNLYEASEKIGCSKYEIVNCADGEAISCKGKILFWADELLDENGNIDFEKGQALAEQRIYDGYYNRVANNQKKYPNTMNYDRALVSFDPETLEYEECGTINEMHRKNMNIQKSVVAKTAQGEQYLYQGKLYVFEDDITEYDSMGNKILNIEKGKEIVKQRLKAKKSGISPKRQS